MANSKSAAKRARGSERRRAINRNASSKAKTASKRAKSIQESGDADKGAAAVKSAYSAIDKAVKTGAIHKNKAARMKSRVARPVAAKAG